MSPKSISNPVRPGWLLTNESKPVSLFAQLRTLASKRRRNQIDENVPASTVHAPDGIASPRRETRDQQDRNDRQRSESRVALCCGSAISLGFPGQRDCTFPGSGRRSNRKR